MVSALVRDFGRSPVRSRVRSQREKLAGRSGLMGRLKTISLVCGILFLTSCAKAPTQPIPPSRLKPIVDAFPTWSHDGRLVAYHRRFSSSNGPPGVYVVNSAGGPSRLLCPGSFSGPWDLRFSPDDRQLVGSWAGQIVFIDIQTGALTMPFFTDNAAVTPDWSPDGRAIVYARVVLPAGEPQDSAGLHLYELSTREDAPIRHNHQVVVGRN